jgi:endonuclease YncB( thermonuclease family)
MGRVIAIADGDTLTILTTEQGQHRVRLAGIDTPEKRQPFGQVAKDHFSSLVDGQTVTVNYLKRDHYGRIVGKVLTSGSDAGLRRQVEALPHPGDGAFAAQQGEELLAAGWRFHSTRRVQ